MQTSLSSLLAKYPFEKYDDVSSLADVHGIYLIIECKQKNVGEIECGLIDFGGAVDVRHAVESSLADSSRSGPIRQDLTIMVAAVSLLECELLLKELDKIDMKEC